MKTRCVFGLFLGLALLLAPGTSHARWMNANMGRFLTMDSYEGGQSQPLSLHKYTYAHGNPVMNTDPSGMFVGGVTEVLSVQGISHNSRTLEGVGLAAFKAGATRGISSFVLKTGAYGILGLTGGGIAGQVAYLSGAISSKPAALASPQARQQLRVQMETEEGERSDQIIYHYTSAAAAQQIYNEKRIVASPKKIFLGNSFPSGVYATDVQPWSIGYTRTQLSGLFYGGNEGRDVSWFVAIERYDFTPLEIPGYPNQWIRYAPADTKVPVNVVGIGPNLMNP